MKAKPELTPHQCKEEMDHLLELQKEQAELGIKASRAHDSYKEAKEKLDAKTDEIMKHLAELNEVMPLFDKPEEVPWPFPIPDECKDARLENIAVEPNVLGLTIAIVRHVHDELKVKTLGELQKVLKAEKALKTDERNAAVISLGKRLQPNNAVRLLRAITSFTGHRKKKLPPPRTEKEAAARKSAKATEPEHPDNWRLIQLREIVPEETAKKLHAVDVRTFSDYLNLVDELLQKAPKTQPPHYIRDALVERILIPTEAAQKLLDCCSAYSTKHQPKKGAK